MFTFLILLFADTHGSYCYRHTGKEWPNTHTHTYEDTHSQNKTEQKVGNKKELTYKKGWGEERRKGKRGGEEKGKQEKGKRGKMGLGGGNGIRG